MKRFLLLLMISVLASAFAWAAPRASLVPVKHKDPRVQHHKPHKAAKHKAPKHPHRTV